MESPSIIHHLWTHRVPDWQPTAVLSERLPSTTVTDILRVSVILTTTKLHEAIGKGPCNFEPWLSCRDPEVAGAIRSTLTSDKGPLNSSWQGTGGTPVDSPAALIIMQLPPCRESTIQLQTSMPSPGFKSRPYGKAVSVTTHYTGWSAAL
ncbi:hypothetical protein TNCV_2089041 [Trichonephila clavipes]|nr:hypothetical protein TNCV_2089041 [Trichonephila clavipes]